MDGELTEKITQDNDFFNELFGPSTAAELDPELEFLLGDLTKEKVPKKNADKLTLDGDKPGYLPIRPIHKARIMKAGEWEAMVKLVKEVKFKDYSGYIYCDGVRRCYVYTDSHFIVSLPSDDIDNEAREHQGLDIQGVPINSEKLDYPDYMRVIPTEHLYTLTTDVHEMLARLNGAMRCRSFIENSGDWQLQVSLRLPGEVHYRRVDGTPVQESWMFFEPSIILKALTALTTTGTRRAVLENSGYNKGLLISDIEDSEKWAFIMPVMGNGGDLNPFHTLLHHSPLERV